MRGKKEAALGELETESERRGEWERVSGEENDTGVPLEGRVE